LGISPFLFITFIEVLSYFAAFFNDDRLTPFEKDNGKEVKRQGKFRELEN
jgi:hypothetical protein